MYTVETDEADTSAAYLPRDVGRVARAAGTHDLPPSKGERDVPTAEPDGIARIVCELQDDTTP